MKSMGEQIASLRKKKGMTQSQLAEKMNVTDKAVSKWERDLSCPDINTVSKLADILEVSVEELLKNKKEDYEKKKIKDLIDLILEAIVVAMGVAVVVLNVLKQIEMNASIIMLGIGLLCVGLLLLNNKEDKEE